MNLKILSNQLSKIYNTLGNDWLTKNFETEPFNFRVFVKRDYEPDALGDYLVEVYTYDLIPKVFKYREEVKKDKLADGIHYSVLSNKLKELIKYVVPNMGDFRNTFEVRLMDLHPQAYGATSSDNEQKKIEVSEQLIHVSDIGKNIYFIFKKFVLDNINILRKIYQDSQEYALRYVSPKTEDEKIKSDAMRHILASAKVAKAFGAKTTHVLGWSNEVAGAFLNGIKTGDFDSGWKMDEANNKIGVKIGTTPNISNEELIKKVQNVIDTGDFYLEDGKTKYNEKYPKGK